MSEDTNIGSGDSQLCEQLAVVRQARLEILEHVRSHVREIKALNNRPPLIVRRAIEAVYLLLSHHNWVDAGEQELRNLDLAKEWPRIQRSLSTNSFCNSVLSFEVSALDSAPQVAEFVARKYFPDILEEFVSSPYWQSALDSLEAAETTPKEHFDPTQELSRTGPLPRPLVKADARQGLSLSRSLPAPMRSLAARSTFCLSSSRLQRLPIISGKSSVAGAATAVGSMIGSSYPSATLRRASSQVSIPGDISRMRSTGYFKKAEFAPTPIDFDAVEHGSHACSFYVSWAAAVLREFFTSRCLQRQRAACQEQSEAARESETLGMPSDCDGDSFPTNSSSLSLAETRAATPLALSRPATPAGDSQLQSMGAWDEDVVNTSRPSSAAHLPAKQVSSKQALEQDACDVQRQWLATPMVALPLSHSSGAVHSLSHSSELAQAPKRKIVSLRELRTSMATTQVGFEFAKNPSPSHAGSSLASKAASTERTGAKWANDFSLECFVEPH